MQESDILSKDAGHLPQVSFKHFASEQTHKFEESRNQNGFIHYFHRKYSAVIQTVIEKDFWGIMQFKLELL